MGGVSAACLEVATTLYAQIVSRVVPHDDEPRVLRPDGSELMVEVGRLLDGLDPHRIAALDPDSSDCRALEEDHRVVTGELRGLSRAHCLEEARGIIGPVHRAVDGPSVV